MLRIDKDEAERYWKVLVYGDTGTGKTSLGVTAQKLGQTLVLLSERQGMNPIREAARRLGVPVPAVLLMQDVGHYKAVANALHCPKDKPFRVLGAKGDVLAELETWPTTVVIDSISDAIGNMLVAYIRKLAPQKTDDSGLPKDADRFFNVLKDKTQNFVTEFRDCPVNVLFLAGYEDKEVGKGENARRRVGPRFPMRNLDTIAASACNLVGQSYRMVQGGKPVHQVGFVFPSHVMSKACYPIRPIEVADFSEWVNRLNDATSPASMVEQLATDDLEQAVDASIAQDQAAEKQQQQPRASAKRGAVA